MCLTFLQRERSVDSRGIQLNLGVYVAWRSFWVVLGKREIALDSTEANGIPEEVKNIVERPLKLISAKQKPWGNKMVSPIIAFYSDSITLMLLDFARLILCTISFTKLPKECSNYGQTQNFFPPSQLSEIEERVKSVEVPSDIGRLPMRITSDCGSYTAEQWKTGHSLTLFSAFKVFYQRNIFGASRNLCQHVNFC